jgi:uncharacterized BrkB/YihY/UPF0761 family membrane protein
MSANFKLLLLLLVVLVVVAGLYLLVRLLVRRLFKVKPRSAASLSVTPAGLIWAALQVLVMVAIAILFNVYPDSAVARWLASPLGLAAAILGFVAFCAIMGALLGRRGITLVRRG